MLTGKDGDGVVDFYMALLTDARYAFDSLTLFQMQRWQGVGRIM